MPSAPVPLEIISARIRERQEAGRLHREIAYRRRCRKNYEWRMRHAAALRAQRAAIEDAALIARAEALAKARAEAAGELAELVAEQERDEQFGHRIGGKWLLRLDAPDRYGRPLHETVAA